MRGAVAAIAAALVFGGVAAAGATTRPLAHVTVIGDSVAGSIGLNPVARQIVSQGVDVDLELAPCRRVDGVSCPYDGSRPQNVVELAQAMGSQLGPNVVVAVGYNDFEDEYASDIEHALAAFAAAGVKHVWWLTLRAARHPYLTMNDDIEAAARNHPELQVIDWNRYSRSHPDWFQDDGLHLLHAGSNQMATLIHATLVSDGIATAPPQITTRSLPLAHRGRPYRGRLAARSGVAPFRWSLLERAPAGVHLEPDGVVQGRPRVGPGRYAFDVRVVDAAGSTATRRLTLRILR